LNRSHNKHSTPTPPVCLDWQTILAQAVRSPTELCRRLGLDPALAAEAEGATANFPLLVPQPYLNRIRPGCPDDPLLRQILPLAAERIPTPGFDIDPLGEFHAANSAGLLRKYQGRLLIVTTGACGVHCRFCFRRHFPYPKSLQTQQVWTSAIQTIAADPSISEVILSGGDPLTLQDSDLAYFFLQLEEIPHLRRVRIHTRMPVIIPQRVTAELLSLLLGSRLSRFVVIHMNHPAEIDVEVASALGRLVDAGVPVLNQAVLLRGVNDRADVLVELCQRLVDLRVMPYYLHQLDAVAGAAHFAVPMATGIALIAELRKRLPGYAVPRYVRETQGGLSKEVLA
jgi:L-lysine 2,3-aminomutase